MSKPTSTICLLLLHHQPPQQQHPPKFARKTRARPHTDDLEVEIVAALEAQLQQESREISAGNVDGSWASSMAVATPPNGGHGGVGDVDTAGGVHSPKGQQRKLEQQQQQQQKKRWKNAWGWKYSPGGKQSSIEEEPDSPRQSSTKLSSPANSPKHRANITATTNTVGSASASQQTLHTSASASSSPLRRQKSPSPSTRSGGHGAANRASAGARLCQMIDDSQDESGDELQSLLLVNGRPASVHIVQATPFQ